MNNQYFILRHGETIYQLEKKEFTYPKLDSSTVRLTKNGGRMIQRAGKQLKKEGVDLIYSSDFFRTRQTAGIAAKALGVKEINFDKRLRDINLGIYRGKTKKEFYADFSDPRERFSQKPRGGESWNDVKKRMLEVIRETEKKHKGKKILIISHGDPLWLLEGTVRGLTNQEMLDEIFVRKKYINVGEARKL